MPPQYIQSVFCRCNDKKRDRFADKTVVRMLLCSLYHSNNNNNPSNDRERTQAKSPKSHNSETNNEENVLDTWQYTFTKKSPLQPYKCNKTGLTQHNHFQHVIMFDEKVLTFEQSGLTSLSFVENLYL